MTLRAPSFRTRILLIVLIVSVVPLALVGLWLTGSAQRSGRALLSVRLEEALDQTVSRLGDNWLRQRSDLLFLAEADAVQRALSADAGPIPSEAPETVRALFDGLEPSMTRVTIEDLDGRALWTLVRPVDGLEPTLRHALAIHRRFPSEELGRLVVDLEFAALLGGSSLSPTVAGMVLGTFDATTGALLSPLPFDPNLLGQETFAWGGDQWLTVRRQISEPAMTLVAAAPLSPFAGPFEDAARRGALWLAVVAFAGLLLTYLLTRRMTRSLERLAAVAGAVSRGDLDVRIEDPGTDEVGRVAGAFNTMTASLRRTLRELASRERLAAVGEFAATLAHEVRNPLTAIRIDLQRVEESLPADSPLREAQARALREISRLDATVTETLDVARSGDWHAGGVMLAVPLKAAAAAAEPAFTERGATLDLSAATDDAPTVRGDERALEQLFLNLMLNAARALDEGGRAWIELDQRDGRAVVRLHDTGSGIEADVIDRIFDPLYTTRPDGTGLGLTVVRRIVDEHQGEIVIDSEVGVGTTVQVSLPQ